MKLGDFLNNLAKKVGKENDPALVAILSVSELANRDIADEFATAIDTGLMSLDGAKNNPAVLNHFKPIILKAADDKFALLGEEFGASDEITAEKSTYKKFDILKAKIDAKIQALEAKQGKGGNPEKEAQMTAQIQQLQGQLAQLTDAKKNELETIKQQHTSEMTDMLVRFNLTGKKYANKDLPVEVNTLTAKTLLEAKMRESGAILVNDNGTLKLKQAANPTMDYVDAGFKPVSFNDFSDKILAESKLLEVSGGNPPATPPATPPARIPGGNGGQQQINMSGFTAAMEASMNDVKTN